jgi:hypothetical protein
MATLVLLRNPLTPLQREEFALEAGCLLIDWLQLHYPQGFGVPMRCRVNDEELALDDLDYAVKDEDVVVIALMPAEPATLTAIGVSLLISAVLSVATYFVMRAFMPKESAGKGDATSIYDINSDQNSARIGDPVPVVYGNVIFAPDYVTQPYTWFSWSQANYDQLYNGVQYLDMILCVGQGNVDVTDVFVGDTDAATIDYGVVSYQVFKPAQHLKALGNIATSMGGGFHENVVTSPEVSNQDFLDTGDSAGPFAVCKAGQKGSKIQIDITFPAGQVDPDADGDLRGRTTKMMVYYNEIDDNDAQVGIIYSQRITASADNAAVVSGPNMTNITTTSEGEKNKTAISSPIRRSYMLTMPKSARWAVKIVRETVAPNAKNGADRFIWTGLKLYADYPTGTAYGDVTLLAVRIKASQGLGSDASVRLRVRAQRLLPPPAGGSEAATKSGADAFADVYTDDVYGAGRPSTELDITTLTALRSAWSGYEFNYVFRDRITVWEALRTITTPFGAEPLPQGAKMSIAQDGKEPVRLALFTDANIVADSMSVQYSFDDQGAPDGVEIEYLDPLDFRQSYALWPTTSLSPRRFSVPGITNATHALQYARLTWQRGQLQRKRVSFETEMEGLLLQLGDRVGISHSVPKWGASGQVIGFDGLKLTVDKFLDWTGGAKQILLRRPDGTVTDPYTVTRGTRDNIVVLPVPIPGGNPLPTINVDNAYDYTSFAFGSSTTLVRDFVVISTQPNADNTVTVEAMNYDLNLYTGAMTYMVA